MLKRRSFGAILPALLRSRRSNAAIEFALIAPTMVAMLLGVFEICNAAIVYEQVQNAAHSIPASVSSLAVQGNGATELTYGEIQLAASEIWAEIPELTSGAQDGTKSVLISSVTFIPTLPPAAPPAQTPQPAASCTPKTTPSVMCTYTPTVAWSVNYVGGNSLRTFTSTSVRSCSGHPAATGQSNATVLYTNAATKALSYQTVPGGISSAVPPTVAGSPTWHAGDLTALPTYIVGNPDPNLAPPSPIIVVDVHLKYHPFFGLFFANGIDFYGTGMFPVRSVQSAVVTQTSATTSTSTSQTLTQQFTTIYDDATDAAAGTIPSATAGTYCINTSPYLSPPSTTATAPSS